MAHHIYQTDAFVLNGINTGDSNRYIDVFTREIGLVRASAQGARYEKSKLRYSLQNYTYSNVSLVRGREIWRITGALHLHNTFYDLASNNFKNILCSRVFSVLRRLLHGEEKNEYLFETMVLFVDFLKYNKFSEKELKFLESLVVLRILHNLGYVSDESHFSEFIKDNKFSIGLLEKIEKIEKHTIKEINRALEASHL